MPRISADTARFVYLLVAGETCRVRAACVLRGSESGYPILFERAISVAQTDKARGHVTARKRHMQIGNGCSPPNSSPHGSPQKREAAASVTTSFPALC